MWCSDRRALLGALFALGACGFAPLYGPGTPAAGLAGRIDVAPLDGAQGFALRERLVERLGRATEPTHRLEVDLAFAQEGAAITPDNVTTRFNLTGNAVYRLSPLAGGPPILAEELQAITGFSAPASETASAYATLAAERDAMDRLAVTLADQIVMRLAITAGEWAE